MSIRLSKREGQVFLHDLAVAKDIIESAQLNKKDTIIEIGPGKGILTRLIPKKVNTLFAIEKDSRLCSHLKDIMKGSSNFFLINGNALLLPLDRIGEGCKIVSNLPYNISTPIIFKLLEYKNIYSMTLMVQKEVAERIVSCPGSKKYGRLSVAVQLVSEARLLFYVSNKAFNPVPKVDSAVLQIYRRNRPKIEYSRISKFLSFVQTLFIHRRKVLKNCLHTYNQRIPESTLARCGIDPLIRPERLNIDDMIMLYDWISKDVNKYK